MRTLTRREFSAALAFGASSRALFGKSVGLDDVIRNGIAARKIPCAVAMVANSNRILYQGAFGTRDSSGVKVALDSIFAIASMTKAITSTAALQMVERGLVTLDEPVERVLQQLRGVGVLLSGWAHGTGLHQDVLCRV